MNIKVDFDNIVVKEDKNDFNVKVLMLKGEKGDAGEGENNVIEKVQVNGTDLPVTNKTVNVTVPTVDSTLSSSSTNSVQNKTIYNALSNKADTSELDNYYEISEVDDLLSSKVNTSTLDNYYARTQTYSQSEVNTLLDNKANVSEIETINTTLLTKANTNDVANNYETITNHNTDISALRSQISSLSSGSPLVASSISDMADTTRVYVNTTDGNWYYYNGSSWVSGGIYQSTEIGESSIGYNELEQELKEFIEPSINIVNLYDKLSDTYVNYLTGALMNSTGFTTTEFIPVNPSTTYYIPHSNLHSLASLRIVEYKENKTYNTYTLGNSSVSSITTDSNTKFVRIGYMSTDNNNIYLSLEDITYTENLTPYYIDGEKLCVNSIDGNILKKNSISIENLMEVNVISSNLFNPYNEVFENLYPNGDTGLINISNNLYFTSHYLKIEPDISYVTNGLRICIYDKEKNFIKSYTKSGQNNITFTSPSNACFMVIGDTKANRYSISFCKGSTLVKDNYSYTLQGFNISNYEHCNIANMLYSHSNVKIKLIGDSITAGVGGTGYNTNGEEIGTTGYYRNPNGYCWAKLLKDDLESKFDCSVTNNAISGKGSNYLATYINQLVDDDDDIVICMVGTNDRVDETSFDNLYGNLNAIYNYCLNKGIKFIPMASIPASITDEERENGTFSVRYKHMEDINHVISAFACNNKLEYIGLFEPFFMYCFTKGVSINTLLADGLHPNDNGYYLMYRIIMKNLGLVAKIQDATW